nr:hypothetical protein CFP56_51336 [Quercus suber]
MIANYEQDLFIKAEATNGIGNAEKVALSNLAKLTRDGVIDHAGYNSDGEAFGLCFGGLERSEPKLIEITYGFEQATRIRKPPKLKT